MTKPNEYDVHVPTRFVELDGEWRAEFDITWDVDGKEKNYRKWCCGSETNELKAFAKISELTKLANEQGPDALAPYLET